MSAGKGDTPRPVKGETFRDNFDTIFPNAPKPTWSDWIGSLVTGEEVDANEIGSVDGQK
jgi:hypothetical protein